VTVAYPTRPVASVAAISTLLVLSVSVLFAVKTPVLPTTEPCPVMSE
jgi:hypothetical protein